MEPVLRLLKPRATEALQTASWIGLLKRAPCLKYPEPSSVSLQFEIDQEVSYWELSSLTQVLFPQAVQVFGVLQSFHSFSLFSLQKVHRSEVRYPSSLTHPLSKHFSPHRSRFIALCSIQIRVVVMFSCPASPLDISFLYLSLFYLWL